MATWAKQKLPRENGELVDMQVPILVSASRSTDIPQTKMKFSLKGRKSLIYIWERQERKCPLCGQLITKQTPWRTMFTEDNKTRLLVHDKCYRSYVYKKRSK